MFIFIIIFLLYLPCVTCSRYTIASCSYLLYFNRKDIQCCHLQATNVFLNRHMFNSTMACYIIYITICFTLNWPYAAWLEKTLKI